MSFELNEEEWVEGWNEAGPEEKRSLAFQLIGKLEVRLSNLIYKLTSESNYSTKRAIEEAQQLIDDGKLKPRKFYSERSHEPGGERDEGTDSTRGSQSQES